MINEKLSVLSKENDDFFYNPTQLAAALTMTTNAVLSNVQNATAAEAATAAATAAAPPSKAALPPVPPQPHPKIGGTRRKRHSRRF